MRKKYLTSCFLISLFSLSACAQTQNWSGTYVYEASLGENAAEDQAIIDYVFTLNGEKCLITSQGYQTDEKILCSTEDSDQGLLVKFISFENGSTKNIYDVEIYSPKSTLFTLTNKGEKLITTWGTLAPDEAHTAGEYFKKAN